MGNESIFNKNPWFIQIVMKFLKKIFEYIAKKLIGDTFC